jgi:hypothetical protein
MLLLVSSGLLVNTAHGTALDNAQIADLYGQASELFRQANELAAKAPDEARDLYEKSAMRFERIAREGGIHNGKLYYNIGNAYFRMKDIGRAILNYLRAEQYIPGDPNLKQNLAYARKKRLDEIEEKQETQVLKTLFFWHYDLSTKTRVITFTISFMFLWIFAAIRIFAKKSFVGWSMAVVAVLSVLMAGSLVIEEGNLHKTRPGVIISSEVVARKGNSETYEPSFKEPLHSGTEFSLIEDRGSWYHVELVDSRTCWVPSKDVELVR